MKETEFAAQADAMLARIEHALEHCGADLDFQLAAGGVLEIEFADGSMIVVNKHGVAQEIWVAARSGGFHFRLDGEQWRDTRDGEELMARLSSLCAQHAGETIALA